jgi:hypothetical protein
MSPKAEQGRRPHIQLKGSPRSEYFVDQKLSHCYASMLIILYTRAALFFSLAVSMYFLITCIANNFMYIQLSSHPYSFSLFRKYQAEAEAEGKGEQEHAA